MKSIEYLQKSELAKWAKSRGCKAQSAQGITKFLKKNYTLGRSEKTNRLEFVHDHKMHEWLDHCSGGDVIPYHSVYGGYAWVPVIDRDIEELSKTIGMAKNPRKRNIYSGQPVCWGSTFVSRKQTINYKGKFKGYTGSEIYCDYQSAYAVSPSGRHCVLIQQGFVVKKRIAPAGCKFSVDDVGVFVKRISDGMDYHFTMEEFLAKNFVTLVRCKLAKNYVARLKSKREQEFLKLSHNIFIENLSNTAIQYTDSIRAGNCRSGTIEFANRFGRFRSEEIDQAPWLSTLSGQWVSRLINNPRVKSAAWEAFKRETQISI